MKQAFLFVVPSDKKNNNTCFHFIGEYHSLCHEQPKKKKGIIKFKSTEEPQPKKYLVIFSFPVLQFAKMRRPEFELLN